MLKLSYVILRPWGRKRNPASGLSDEGGVAIRTDVKLGGVYAGGEIALKRTDMWEGRQLRVVFVSVRNIEAAKLL